LEEIATFIFPEDFENEPLEHEPGIIYDLSRRVSSTYCAITSLNVDVSKGIGPKNK
jgi:hypothetical protein